MTHERHPKAIRALFAAFGLVCVGVGFIGLVTPGLPGFVFFIIALGAFRNSSLALENWLLNNKYVGPTLRDWDENRSMKLSTKIIAIASIWLAIGFTIYRVMIKPPLIVKGLDTVIPKVIPVGLLAATIIALTFFLLKVKTKTD